MEVSVAKKTGNFTWSIQWLFSWGREKPWPETITGKDEIQGQIKGLIPEGGVSIHCCQSSTVDSVWRLMVGQSAASLESPIKTNHLVLDSSHSVSHATRILSNWLKISLFAFSLVGEHCFLLVDVYYYFLGVGSVRNMLAISCILCLQWGPDLQALQSFFKVLLFQSEHPNWKCLDKIMFSLNKWNNNGTFFITAQRNWFSWTLLCLHMVMLLERSRQIEKKKQYMVVGGKVNG